MSSNTANADPVTVTNAALCALRTEAGAAGDAEQVALCALALEGDAAARAACAAAVVAGQG